jgi:hypothetical protein
VVSDGVGAGTSAAIQIVDDSTVVGGTLVAPYGQVAEELAKFYPTLSPPADLFYLEVPTPPAHSAIVPYDPEMFGTGVEVGAKLHLYELDEGFTGLDSFTLRDHQASYVRTIRYVYTYAPWTPEAERWPRAAGVNRFAVSPEGPTTLAAAATGYLTETPTHTLAVVAGPGHGDVILHPDGGFTYTPYEPEEGEEPYVGWDFFTFERTGPNGLKVRQEVQLDVGMGGDAATDVRTGRPVCRWRRITGGRVVVVVVVGGIRR